MFDRANKLAIGLNQSSSDLKWSYDYFDAPGLSNITSSSAVTADWQGKNNTRVVLEYCKANGKSCPAFEYVKPAMGELNAIYGNKDVLNIALGKIGGTKLGTDWYWSSSEFTNNNAWKLKFGYGNVDNYIKNYPYSVRPVIDYGDWANSSAGDEEDASPTCNVGDIFYSDKTCSANITSGKTPIGVVFDTTNRLIIGLEQYSKYWSDGSFDVPGVSNITSSSAVTADWQGKNNTRVVLEYCKANGKSCPAFEYVNSYKTEGTIAGDWYLPAMGELDAIYGNKDVLNIALGKIGGTKLGTDWYWSSSEYPGYGAWYLRFSDGGVGHSNQNYDSYYVRPVMQY